MDLLDRSDFPPHFYPESGRVGHGARGSAAVASENDSAAASAFTRESVETCPRVERRHRALTQQSRRFRFRRNRRRRAVRPRPSWLRAIVALFSWSR